MTTYEAMIIVDPTFAERFSEAEARVRHLLERHEAKVLKIKKWDERKLAYEINNRKRGVYVLVYFTAPTGAPGKIERDVKLSEELLRILIQRRPDGYVTDELLNADTPFTAPSRDDEYDFVGPPRRSSRPRRDRPDRDGFGGGPGGPSGPGGPGGLGGNAAPSAAPAAPAQ